MKPVRVTWKLCVLVSILVNAFFRLIDYIREMNRKQYRRQAPRRKTTKKTNKN